MSILLVLGLVVCVGVVFAACMGYAVYRSFNEDNYDWDDFDEDVDTSEASKDEVQK